MLRHTARFLLLAFALFCIGPAQVTPIGAERASTITCARTAHGPRLRVKQAPGRIRVAPQCTPFQRGLVGIGRMLSVREPARSWAFADTPGGCSRVVDQRALIRRLRRAQHRPPDAPAIA